LSCEKKATEEIVFNETDNQEAFAMQIKSIELVPLESDSLHYLGDEPDMVLSGSDYIFADKETEGYSDIPGQANFSMR